MRNLEVGERVGYYLQPWNPTPAHVGVVTESLPNGIPSFQKPMVKIEGKSGYVNAAHCFPEASIQDNQVSGAPIGGTHGDDPSMAGRTSASPNSTPSKVFQSKTGPIPVSQEAQGFQAKIYKCEPPCDSYGKCSNCYDQDNFECGYVMGYRAANTPGETTQTDTSLREAHKRLQSLLNKVNKVTAWHRHHKYEKEYPVPVGPLDELCERQIEVEGWLSKVTRPDNQGSKS